MAAPAAKEATAGAGAAMGGAAAAIAVTVDALCAMTGAPAGPLKTLTWFEEVTATFQSAWEFRGIIWPVPRVRLERRPTPPSPIETGRPSPEPAVMPWQV